MFNNLFTTYEMVEPPPIVSDNAKIVQLNYKLFLQTKPLADYGSDLGVSFDSISSNTLDPLKPEVEAPVLFDEFKTPDTTLNTTTNNIIDLARQFVGTKYTWGGSSPSSGFDCSGLLHYVFKLNGIDLPRNTDGIFKYGTEVPSLESAQVGDIICTPGRGATGKHVKIISKIEDGLIWTIEAKGLKDGIIESPLTKTDNIRTIRRISQNPAISGVLSHIVSFSDKGDYAKTMYLYLYQALEDNGIDGDTWAPILTAHTSIESGWGNKFSRENNNFGGIKGKGSKVVSTKEWSPSRGYYTIKDTFKSYPSILAFADDYVKKLKNRFKAFDGTPADYLRNIRRNGYFTASLSDYQRIFNGRLNDVNKLLNS